MADRTSTDDQGVFMIGSKVVNMTLVNANERATAPLAEANKRASNGTVWLGNSAQTVKDTRPSNATSDAAKD